MSPETFDSKVEKHVVGKLLGARLQVSVQKSFDPLTCGEDEIVSAKVQIAVSKSLGAKVAGNYIDTIDIEDELPPNSQIVEGSNKWHLTRVMPGERKEFQYRFKPSAAGTYETRTQVKYSDRFPTPLASSSEPAALVVKPMYPMVVAAISISKTTIPRTDITDVTVFVQNRGDAAATGVKVSIALPKNVVLSEGRNEWTGEIPAEHSFSYTFSVRGFEAGQGTLKLDRTTYYDTKGRAHLLTLAPETGEPSILVTPKAPSLTVKKSVSKEILHQGEQTDVTIEVHNAGDDLAQDVEVRDDLVQGAEVLSGSPSWSGQLDPGGMHAFSYTFRVSQPITYTSKCSASFRDYFDKTYSASSNVVLVKVVRPEPSVQLRGPVLQPEEVMMDQPFTYELRVKNVGEGPALNVSLNFPESAAISLLRAAPATRELAPGEEVTLSAQMKAVRPGKFVIDQVLVQCLTQDGLSLEKSASPVSLRVVHEQPILSVVRLLKRKQVVVGDTIRISTTVKNLGKEKAVSVVAKESLPASVEMVGGTCSWQGELAPQQQVVLDYEVRADTPRLIELEPFTVVYEDIYSNRYSASSTADTVSIQPLEVTVIATKTASKDLLSPLDEVEITVRVDNLSRIPLTDVKISDSFASKLCELVEGRTEWSGQIAANSSHAITYRLRVLKSGEIELPEASVEYRGYDGLFHHETSRAVKLLVERLTPQIELSMVGEPTGLTVGRSSGLELNMQNVGRVSVHELEIRRTREAAFLQLLDDIRALPELRAGESRTIAIRVKPTVAGSFEVRAFELSYLDPEHNRYLIACNPVKLQVAKKTYDIQVSRKVPQYGERGQALKISITIQNVSDRSVRAVHIEDPVDPTGRWEIVECESPSRLPEWSLPFLKPGGLQIFEYALRPKVAGLLDIAGTVLRYETEDGEEKRELGPSTVQVVQPFRQDLEHILATSDEAKLTDLATALNVPAELVDRAIAELREHLPGTYVGGYYRRAPEKAEPGIVVHGDYVARGARKTEGEIVIDKTREERERKELRRFAACPYCGEELNLPKTPRFCPFCRERLVNE